MLALACSIHQFSINFVQSQSPSELNFISTTINTKSKKIQAQRTALLTMAVAQLQNEKFTETVHSGRLFPHCNTIRTCQLISTSVPKPHMNSSHSIEQITSTLITKTESMNKLQAYVKVWPFTTITCFGTSAPLAGSSYTKLIKHAKIQLIWKWRWLITLKF